MSDLPAGWRIEFDGDYGYEVYRFKEVARRKGFLWLRVEWEWRWVRLRGSMSYREAQIWAWDTIRAMEKEGLINDTSGKVCTCSAQGREEQRAVQGS